MGYLRRYAVLAALPKLFSLLGVGAEAEARPHVNEVGIRAGAGGHPVGVWAGALDFFPSLSVESDAALDAGSPLHYSGAFHSAFLSVWGGPGNVATLAKPFPLYLKIAHCLTIVKLTGRLISVTA